ncbi:hypothetical protein ONZ45_g7311 [Pleurotus djamor]|nr:hypothetical protein ONZ45_g7311 [Pleurotus djamor]
MDDDWTLGASVWSTNDPGEPITILPSTSRSEEPITPMSPTTPLESYLTPKNQFDDFDDEFGEVAQPMPEDDDFGDFGDFEESQGGGVDEATNFDSVGDFSPAQIPSSSATATWEPLRLDPLPSKARLESYIRELLSPAWGSERLSDLTTEDSIREAEGIAQILVAPESRDVYNSLVKSLPTIKPPNWTRSRIRRQHLISLGVPVNLDEVMPHANGKPLPPLQISTPQMGGRGPSPFGPKPALDEDKINELLNINPDSLTIQPLSVLERYLAEIRSHTAETSGLLTHLLQSKDALQQNSETYNKLIAELVGEAQKIKSGKVRAPVRRGTAM